MENKVIFESDEALDKFLDDCEISDKELRKCIKYFAKFKGYIRKSAVEEAEEAIYLYQNGTSIEFDRKYTIQNFIQLLILSFKDLKQQLKNKE